MKLWPTNNQQVLEGMNAHESKFSILTNGQKLYHPWYLDGGGGDYRHYFLRALSDYGKPKYVNAYEWCCGHSIIGFEILTHGKCENLTVSDYYDVAVNVSLENAKNLGYESRVKGYITPVVSSIPLTEKWDLVVGNPPNSMNGDYFIQQGKKDNLTDEHINHSLRLAVDEEFECHRECFNNLKNYITEDADVFITLHETVFTYFSEKIGEPAGFVITNVIDMMPRDTSLKIAHIKVK